VRKRYIFALLKNQHKMKKVFNTIAVAALLAGFTACGPSKEEIQAAEKRKADSIEAVRQHMQDSIDAANAEAALIAAETEKRIADSTRVADSLAASSKGKKKK